MMNPNGTTTLAESLLMDLDDLSDDNEEEEVEEAVDENGVGDDSNDGGVTKTNENSQKDVNYHDLTGLHLLQGSSWKSHRNEIQRLLSMDSSNNNNNSNNNFEMLIKSTPFLSLMDNEMLRAHDELVHNYGKQYFPELSDLIIDPKQYHQVVTILFREQTLETISSPRISEELSQILTSNQFLTVSVAACTSTITQQTQDGEKKKIIQFILNYVDQLLECNQELIAFLERGMQQYAPNVTILVGSAKCAAKLIGAAGGLEELCQMPACNLQVLGRATTTTTGGNKSKATVQGDGSILWNYCDMIVNCRPRSLQPKLCKQVANKLALVARCDLSNRSKSTVDTSQGLKFRQIIQDKYQKLQEPDKAPVVKALPNCHTIS